MKIIFEDGCFSTTCDFSKVMTENPTCKDALMGTLHILSSIYSQRTVIETYSSINPDKLEEIPCKSRD